MAERYKKAFPENAEFKHVLSFSEFRLSHKISAFDMVVYNAICTWYAFGNTTFTLQDLYNIMCGMCGGERRAIHPEMRQFIFDSALRLARTSVDITHYKGDFSRGTYQNTENKYCTQLISTRKVEVVLGNGTIQDAFRILEEPILYKIARVTNRVLSAPVSVYRIPEQNNTTKILTIKQYLFIRMMNARTGTLNRVIKYETLFEECEIYTDSRVEKRRIREIVTQILNEWVNQGFLTGFEEQKKGNSIVGVELFFKSSGKLLRDSNKGKEWNHEAWNPTKLARRIAETRKRCGLTQAKVAKALYCTSTCVCHWEYGRSEPGVAQIVELCKLFGVSADYLLGLKEG